MTKILVCAKAKQKILLQQLLFCLLAQFKKKLFNKVRHFTLSYTTNRVNRVSATEAVD